MKNAFVAMVAAVVLSMVASPLVAGDGCCNKQKEATAKATGGQETAACCALKPPGCAAASDEQTPCGGKGICSNMIAKYVPAILYRVGDYQTSNEKTARSTAQRKGYPVTYIVDGKGYENESDAVTACTDTIERNISEMLTVRYAVGDACVACPNAAASLASGSGTKVQILAVGTRFDDEAGARQAVAKAKEAVEQVKLTYCVDEKQSCCPNEAKRIAGSTGGKITYSVGEKRTPCEATAHLLLSQARMMALLGVARG